MANKKNIFNQSMLDKLSSPDQLDKLVVITPLPVWLFVLGGAFIILVALIWSLTGWLSVTTNTNGVFLSGEENYTLASAKAGIVKEVMVERGDTIKAGDVLFKFDTLETERMIEELQERRSQVQDITLYSDNDVASQDTADLISLKLQYQSSGSSVAQSDATIAAYEEELAKIKSQITSAEKKIKSAEGEISRISEGIASGTSTEAELNAAKATYTALSNEYTGLLTKRETINSQISQAKAQKKIASIGDESSKESLSRQFNMTKSGLLNALDKEIRSANRSLDDSSIKSMLNGVVADLKIDVGSAVGQGTEYITIKCDPDENSYIQCYVPITTGKSIKPGMEVIVYPTNLNRQEYGHMLAEVSEVDSFVTSQSDIRHKLGDDILANMFMQQGAVMGVKCILKKDPDTASGFYWSTNKGKSVVIDQSTAMSCDVVVDKSHPISKLIPYLKQKAEEFVGPKPESNTAK